MVEEEKTEELKEEEKEEVAEEELKETVLDKADRINKEKEALLKREEELIERKEKMVADEMVGGRAEGGLALEKKEETPEEYAMRVQRGETNPLEIDA